MKRMTLIFVCILFLASCASTPKTSFLGEYYGQLEPGPKGGAKKRWIRPGVEFTKYKKLMVDYVVFSLAEDSESKVINGDEMKKLGDACTLAIINALQDKYPITAEPGPDVLRLRFAIVDLKQSRPALSAVSSAMLVSPVGLAINVVRKGATDSWSGSGATTSQWMVLDSMTNEVLAVAEDEYRAGFTERFTKWGSAEDAFRYWGKRIRKVVDVGLGG